jgi:hypothetical protein
MAIPPYGNVHKNLLLIFQIIMAMIMRMAVFWILVDTDRRFRNVYSIHYQSDVRPNDGDSKLLPKRRTACTSLNIREDISLPCALRL